MTMDSVETARMAAQLLSKLRGQMQPSAAELEQHVREAEERHQADRPRRERDEAAMRKDHEDRARALAELALAKLPPKLREAVRGPVDQTDASRAALAWSQGRTRALMLRGGVGVGKSMAAAIACDAYARRGFVRVSWHRPSDFASAVLHSYAPDAAELGHDLVVVDDLGRETRGDFGEALCAFIDDTDTRLILTTNLSRDEFRERYDVRLIDRLGEVGTAVSLKGESRRVKGGAF